MNTHRDLAMLAMIAVVLASASPAFSAEIPEWNGNRCVIEPTDTHVPAELWQGAKELLGMEREDVAPPHLREERFPPVVRADGEAMLVTFLGCYDEMNDTIQLVPVRDPLLRDFLLIHESAHKLLGKLLGNHEGPKHHCWMAEHGFANSTIKYLTMAGANFNFNKIRTLVLNELAACHPEEAPQEAAHLH